MNHVISPRINVNATHVVEFLLSESGQNFVVIGFDSPWGNVLVESGRKSYLLGVASYAV